MTSGARQLLAFTFGSDSTFEGQLVGALERIESGGTVRVLDGLFVARARQLVDIAEAARQLRGEGGDRQVPGAKIGLVTGLGVLPYGKNLGCCAVAVLGNQV